MPLPSIHGGVHLNDILPPGLDHVRGVSYSDAVVQRKRIRIIPQTSPTANPSDIVNFLIQDPGMLDLRSAVLHANICISGVSGVNSSNCVTLDDGVSWCRQLVIQADGQNVETMDRANKLALMETYMGCSSSLYNRALSQAGFWKFNPDLAASGNVYKFDNVVGNATAASEFYNTATWGWDVTVPLGVISHFFRSEKLFPSRFANNLLIQFQLEAAAQALLITGTPTVTGATYQLTNLYLELDTLTLNPSFTAFLQDQVMNHDGPGITLPVNTKISAQGQTQTNNGENTFVVSRASKNLKRVAVVQQSTAGITSGSVNVFPKISTFSSAGFNTRQQAGALQGQVQVYSAGQYYPLYPDRGSAAFWTAMAAFNASPMTDSDGGISTYRTWGTTTDGLTGGTAGTTTLLGAANPNSYAYSDSWIWGYNFDQIQGTSDSPEYSGLDTTGNAQIQLTIKTGPKENFVSGTSGASESYTPLVEMLGTKFIIIKAGELLVQG